MANAGLWYVAIFCVLLTSISHLQLFVKSGYSVNLYDVLFADNKAAVQAALDVISGKLKELKENGLLPDDQIPEELVKNVTPTDSLKAALTGVVYVQV